jgi:hypothetical protein
LLWLFDKLLQCIFKQEKQALEKTTPHGKQTRQFTRDDAARITASTVNAVFEKLAIGQIVESIAVLPAGEGVYLVDVVIRDLSLDCTWNGAITIPPTTGKCQ